MEEERAGTVFLTFWMVTGSEVSLEGNLCSSWSNFVRDVASIMYFFKLKGSIFHQIGPSCWQGPKM